MRKLISMTAVLLAMGVVSTAQAGFVPTTDEFLFADLEGESLFVLDKEFHDFALTEVTGDGGAVVPLPELIKVTGGFNDVNDDNVWQFGEDVVLKMNLAFNVGKNQAQNATVSFGVSVGDNFPNALIKDVKLEATGLNAEGTGVVNVSETVYDAPPPGANLLLDNPLSVAASDGETKTQDWEEFDPLKSIYVVKDISISGGTGVNLLGETPGPDTAHISEIFQSFSQVPEPATVALLGLGGLVMIRRRK
jgi:hypothetical protein